jgi:hypothetical protein
MFIVREQRTVSEEAAEERAVSSPDRNAEKLACHDPKPGRWIRNDAIVVETHSDRLGLPSRARSSALET